MILHVYVRNNLIKDTKHEAYKSRFVGHIGAPSEFGENKRSPLPSSTRKLVAHKRASMGSARLQGGIVVP